MERANDSAAIGVFLVDDHRCMLWGLERLIAGEAPRMRVAGMARSPEEALAGVAAARPDVVLLDLDLGDSSGLDLLPRLGECSEAQVLVLTGVRDAAVLDRAIALGARGAIGKDAGAELLVRAIERVHAGELWADAATLARVLGSMTRPSRADAKRSKAVPLTPKERRIVETIVTRRGAKGDVIAADLHMSGHTLRNHLTSIYRKLDVRNRLELVMFAIENRLVPSDAQRGG